MGVELIYSDDGMHVSWCRTLINGLKIGALLINEGDPPSAVGGSVSFVYPREVTLNNRALRAFTVLERQAFISY